MRQQRSKEWFLEHVVVCVLQNPWHHTNTLERQAITSHRRGSIGPAGRVFTDWLHKLLLKMLKSVRNQGSAEPQTGAAAGVMQKKVESRMATFLMRPHPVTLRVWCFRGGEEASRKIGAGGGVGEGWGVSSTVKNSFVSTANLYLSRKVSHFSTWFAPFLSFQNGNRVPNGALIQERPCIPNAAVLSSFSEDNPFLSPRVKFFSSTHTYLTSFLVSFSQPRSGPFPLPGA